LVRERCFGGVAGRPAGTGFQGTDARRVHILAIMGAAFFARCALRLQKKIG
jgi:hypothetical protein